jgi:serine/threonine-protein kinase
VVLYEMLTGRPPFTGDSPVSVAFQHVSTEAPNPSSINPDVPESLDSIVIKALRKDPQARYQSADEMRADLLAVLRGEEVAVPIVAGAGVAAAAAGDDSTKVMTAVPPPTVPPDEVYRDVEDEPPSQIPFILTAFGLLAALVILLFVLFRVAGTDNNDGDLIPVPNVNGLTQQEAIDRLEAEGFEVAFEFEPNETVETGNVIRSDPEGGTEAERGSTVTLFISSGSESIEVPTLIGQTLENARTRILAANLTVGDIRDMPSADFDAGVVISQSPDAGIRVGTGTPVNLVVSTGPEIVEIPDLEGFTEVDAISELVNLGLDFDTEEEFSNTVDDGFVIRTDPAAGEEAMSGDVVLIVVSKGPAPIDVPSLILLTEDEARAILEGEGLVLQVATSTQPVVDPSQDGLIVDQSPEVGATLFPGDIVVVTLGEFTPPPTTTTEPPPDDTTTTDT